MVKTQVQLPDHLYREGKRIAAQYEMSFAEVVRRGLEYVIPAFPPRSGGANGWSLPTIDVGLSHDPFVDPDWRERLHLGGDSASPRRRRARAGRGSR